MLPRLLIVLALGLPALGWTAPDKSEVTAAMIYRLTKFISWPADAFADAQDPFRICFDGATSAFEKLSTVALKPWRDREVVVTAEVSANCQVVVTDDPQPLELGPHSLLIGEQPAFLDKGGHIAFQFTRGRIGFLVNHTDAQEQGLTLSSELLSLARQVR